ncbi:MAG: ABC transporter permease [Streptosporangiaceae bacterium]
MSAEIIEAASTAGTLGTARPGPAGARSRVGQLSGRMSFRRALAQSLTLAWRNVAQLRHSPEKLLDVIVMPIVFMVLFLFVFGAAVAGSTHAYLEELLPGLIAQMAMFATMSLGSALCEDIHKGVFDRFRSLPVARCAPLAGAVIGDSVRFLTVMTVLTGFGCAIGFRFHASALSILAAYGLAYAFYLAACWVSVLLGLIVSSPRSVQGISFIWTMPLTFGSSVLMADTAKMPGWLQAWVKVNPVTHLADSLRALTIGGPVGDHVVYTLAWSAGIVVVTFPIAMRLYARRV